MPDDRTENVQRIPVQQTAEEPESGESLEDLAQKRQKNRDDEWEKYLAGRERGGVKGFFNDINEKMTQFGSDLYHNINKQ